MLVLVRHVSPLGLVASLVISLVWVPPVVILTVRMAGDLLAASGEWARPKPSWLVRLAARLPGWVVLTTGMWAALSWELRFLPTLTAVLLATLGLAARRRYPAGHPVVFQVAVLLPIVLGVVELAVTGPAIGSALAAGEVVTALLFAVPPVVCPLLAGPLPTGVARFATHWPATVCAFAAPIAVGTIFLHTPVLPSVALEIGSPTEVARGRLIDVDNQMTLLLNDAGDVRFILNDLVHATTLCPDAEQLPYSVVTVHGWQVERPALRWLLPSRSPQPEPQQCEGRLPG